MNHQENQKRQLTALIYKDERLSLVHASTTEPTTCRRLETEGCLTPSDALVRLYKQLRTETQIRFDLVGVWKGEQWKLHHPDPEYPDNCVVDRLVNNHVINRSDKPEETVAPTTDDWLLGKMKETAEPLLVLGGCVTFRVTKGGLEVSITTGRSSTKAILEPEDATKIRDFLCGDLRHVEPLRTDTKIETLETKTYTK